ncbi:MAG: hypothetical protein ACTSXM_11155 [Promethearchaeota archaeon]
MMKKKREISISVPQLRNIAQNFRDVWRVAVWARIDSLKASKRYGEANDLELKYRNSILLCCTCHLLKGDRIYNPRLDQWHCPKCWGLQKEFYISMMEKKKQGKNLGDFNEESMSSFL